MVTEMVVAWQFPISFLMLKCLKMRSRVFCFSILVNFCKSRKLAASLVILHISQNAMPVGSIFCYQLNLFRSESFERKNYYVNLIV